ncbi:MAG: 4-(cytidine 5'-diphospho)-2-C-methyl-D-erythritol kinase [Chitinophagaceae bacterium]|nr:MAG: 4-(cytidine 5'-diphospho)-2-C-methyl-D-erythritol kinase [Chitinophagaceae bacterium]
MIQFPHCKINLGLSILEKRKDGFHNLETVFYPVGLKDIIEITPLSKPTQKVAFSSSGIAVPGNDSDNLCVKAYQLLKNDFPHLPSIQMHLHKAIPMGAGLGGGSSDATAVIKILNKLFTLELSEDALLQYTAQLGSDCPFFLHEQPCHATGRGEILNPLSLSLKDYQIVLIHPAISISTAWAFQQIQPATKKKNIIDIIQQPIHTWKQDLINDFESPILAAHPILQSIKTELYEKGAIYASMSGSGSSFFGIFEQSTTMPSFSFSAQMKVDFIS